MAAGWEQDGGRDEITTASYLYRSDSISSQKEFKGYGERSSGMRKGTTIENC
jgi:hypothetical protein